MQTHVASRTPLWPKGQTHTKFKRYFDAFSDPRKLNKTLILI